ncbi:DUF3943 domain-containing protein [bacterium]|nr:DUF3943 domain-containing protein [bacterium]
MLIAKRRSHFLLTGVMLVVLFSATPVQSTPGGVKDFYGPVISHNGQTLAYFRTSLASYSFQWVFILSINRELGRSVFNSNFKKWLKNITTVPEIPDGDHWVTNYIGHPLLGASVYAFYRNRGFSNKASIAGTFLQSTLFEYTVEAWKQPPSGVDLVVTPILGSLVGSHVGMNSFLLSSSYAVTKYLFRLF